MREHPILFSTNMVKAILAGRKTTTRRVIKNPARYDHIRDCDFCCPYGEVGSHLWVRETWYSSVDKKELYGYVADGDAPRGKPYRIRPSIFLPRSYSRILLEITKVSVQKLQEISETDAKNEGSNHSIAGILPATYRECFINLWDSINAKRGYSWESNPWVWVISFERTK